MNAPDVPILDVHEAIQGCGAGLPCATRLPSFAIWMVRWPNISICGWLKDKFGLSWQVVPTALGRYLSDPDRQKADRAMQAMMKMQKIVIADLDRAFAG